MPEFFVYLHKEEGFLKQKNMKRVVYMFFVMFALVCASCSKDDGGISSESLVGHWQSVHSRHIYRYVDTGEEKIEEKSDNAAIDFVLYGDGRCKRSYANGTWSFADGKLNLYTSYYHSSLGKEIKGEKLYDVISLKGSEMIIEEHTTGRDDEYTSEGYIEHELQITSTYTLKKIE